MKNILLLICFITGFTMLHAQDTLALKSPKTITKLKLGNRMDFASKAIQFIKVTEDSRCPSDALCVWAGEAKAIIGIYLSKKKSLFLEIKTSLPIVCKN